MSGRMIKTHLRRLFTGTAVYGIGGMLQQLVGFLLLPVFTAYLATADYGVIGILSVVGFLLTPIFQMGIGVSAGVVYFDNDDARHRNQVIWTALCMLLIGGVGLAVVAVVFDERISLLAFQDAGYAMHVRIFLTGIACTVATQPLFLRLQFEERARLFVTLSLFSTLLIVSLNLVLVVGYDLGVMGWIIGTAIGQGITFLALLVCVALPTSFGFKCAIAGKLLRVGLPMVPSFAFLFLMGQSGKYMLQWFHGLDAAGIYEIGFRFGGVVILIVGAFNTAWYPFFQSFSNKREEARELFGQILVYYVMGLGSLCVLAFVAARPVILVMTQPAYFEAYRIIGIVTVANVFIGIFSCFTPGVYYAKRVYLISAVQAVCSVVVLVANVLLIPEYGLVGTAVAMLLGFVTMGVLQQMLNRTLKLWTPAYQWRRMVTILVLIVASIAITVVADSVLSDVPYLVACLLLAIGYCVMLWLLLLPEERSLVRACLGRLGGPK